MMTEQQQPQTDMIVLDEAKNLLVQGKRSMALEDYQSATDCLEQACQLFDAFYGIGKRECADAYLEYGTALVALANLEAGSGTDRLMKRAGIEEEEEGAEDEGEDEEAEDEEEEEEERQEGEEDSDTKDQVKTNGETEMDHTNAENGKTTDESVPMESSQEVKQTNGTDEHMKESDIQHQATSSSAQPVASSSEPVAGTSNGADAADQDDETENEEASTIEVAWEVLCLARGVYMKDESLEGRMKLAETLQKLGEISIEWDNNDNAASILEECLNIRKAILQPDDRLIALTYYNLGLAHSFRSDIQNANDNFQNAINVIEKRIASLNDLLTKAKEAQDTVTVGSYQKEINELKELLPDMTMRLDDSKEDGTKSTEVLKRTREEMQLEDEEAKKVCLDRSKPVDDISHLVKRKAT